MRIIAIIIPLMWGTLIFGHGEEKHEPKIIDDHKIDNTSQKLIPVEGESLNSLDDKENNTKTNVVAETVEESIEPPEKVEITAQLEAKRSMGKWPLTHAPLCFKLSGNFNFFRWFYALFNSLSNHVCFCVVFLII